MSGGSNQRTLFQTWGACTSQNKPVQPVRGGKRAAEARGTASSSNRTLAPTHPPRISPWAVIGQESLHASEKQARSEADILADEEDDDDLMVVAVYEAEKNLQLENPSCFQDHSASTNPALSPTPSRGRIYPDFPGFDSSSANVWIYPTNYPIREYQLKMSEVALFQNTLVCLPTGLGKTFIASVVMYNFYRWYPSGKIVFMAPTKPLVAQQIEACYKVMGIPQVHMAELTGSTAAKQRQELWMSKRVFFLTPQVLVNDLSRDTCPAKQVKCVVIDEAHKALGNHAYCQVIRLLSSQTLQFRILALSATPGGDAKSVQSVISNLLISHVELRSEESADIQAHSHQRTVEKAVVPPGETLSAYQARYLQVLEKFMSRLVQNQVMAHKDLRTLSKYQLILTRDQFRRNPPPHIKGPKQGVLEGDFALCISLYHGYELLMQTGLRSLFFYVQGIMDGSREMSRAKNELQRTPIFLDMYHEMEAMFVKPAAGPDEPFVYSHPKLEKLEEVVLQHFKVWAERSASTNGSEGVSTRVMIFSSFRESVQEIAAMLNRHAPLIRVMTFMGQASSGKGVKGFTQKEQLEVVHRFRQGGFNTLVSTCVGEEGLDIGEVDLIVCFDVQKNPIRLVQRMGRTGRKRQGRIVVILAEGREERTYNQSQSNKRSVYKSITGNKSGFHMFPNSPRMLPEGVNPKLHKMFITCGQFDPKENSRRSVRGRRSHTEGRTSLIHPQNLFQQGNPTSDGFLSSAEYSLWASTMKLDEQETHPTLRPSRFLSIPSDPEHQEDVSKVRPSSRELSLWEWRHWQHKALPFNVVDHSRRCNHFIEVMELIDGMREETEGECRYEQELLPYLRKEEAEKNRQKKLKATKLCTKTTNRKPKPSSTSWSELECIDKKMEREHVKVAELVSSLAIPKQRLPVEKDPEVCCVEDYLEPRDSAITNVTKADHTLTELANLNDISHVNDKNEDLELQAMFYLPKWNSGPEFLSDKPRKDLNLETILTNVAELLSRSPPLLADIFEEHKAVPLVPPSPQPPHQPPHQPFHVSFSLDVDDDDEVVADEVVADDVPLGADLDEPSGSKDELLVHSPTWDEVFEAEDVIHDANTEFERQSDSKEEHVTQSQNDGMVKKSDDWDDTRGELTSRMMDSGVKDKAAITGHFLLDESMDLFEDDEAFLQMTIPDIPTPEEDVTPSTSLNTENTTAPLYTSPKPSQLPDGTHRTHTLSTSLKTKRTQSERVTDDPKKVAPRLNSSIQGNPEAKDGSHVFPVNFDLGYSLEDSEDEAVEDVLPLSSSPTKQNPSAVCLPPVSKSTPSSSFTRQFNQPKVSSSHMPTECRTSKREALPSPITPAGARRKLVPGFAGLASFSLKQSEGSVTTSRAEDDPRQESVHGINSPHPAEHCSDSEEEILFRNRRHHNKVNPLASPELMASDVDSPVVVKKKRAFARNTLDETQDEAVSDDDFRNDSMFTCRTSVPGVKRKEMQQVRDKNIKRHKVRQFLDEEAELSEDEEGADVSSDEEDDKDLDRSLEGFVVDNAHLSQELNDSEMHGVYLKSVRSPAVQGKFKMSYRNQHNMDIFSQVPEMDETYTEDSFVVGSDEEELVSNEEEAEDVELMPEASFVDGRRQYATRRRVFLHKARARAGSETRADSLSEQRAAAKTKRSRVIRINDSSEEEEDEGSKKMNISTGGNKRQQEPTEEKSTSSFSTLASRVSLLSKAQRSSTSEELKYERCQQKLENQHLLSDELDFVESESSSKKELQELPTTSSVRDVSVKESPCPPGSACILVDSRCISSGVELMASLRQRHAATVHVCSLDSSYFIVSNRMAVERRSRSDLATVQNRKRLVVRMSSLLGLFERVCLIVEKDRTKPGEPSRPFLHTRYYDGTLAALVRAGIRLLWSDGAEESAGLLTELATLEHRKGQGVSVPLEVKGQHRQQALQLYLSLPSLSYVHALNLSHNFTSIAQLMNSSIEAVQKGGCMSRPRAEEVYRFLRYFCDSVLINTSKAGTTT
ncbi:Fanconi anemia group M protein [Nematolebias whitei]|uniref:Fanconi anemia group M protein n=1 Tax=Nematolebias whitei TaxID=451745 RepID=UPI001898EE34|nr:Fanconi anemia group M protein [Nematolebias whitei]